MELGGGVKPHILLSRYVKLKTLKGNVVLQGSAGTLFAIKIGFKTITSFDERYQKAVWDNRGTITFCGKAWIGQGTRISNDGRLFIGDTFCITANTTIICSKEIVIGNRVLISWDVLIMDSDAHKIISNGVHVNPDMKICIKDDVWIGCRVTILKGTIISDNSVVAAGSIVNKACNTSHSVIGDQGVILKETIKWHR